MTKLRNQIILVKTGSYSAEVEKRPWIVLVCDIDLVCLVFKIGLNML